MAYLITPIGPPAAGKTALRQWLLERGFPASGVVSPDDYRTILTGDQANQTANGIAFDICDKITNERLKRDQDVYFDATNLTRSRRDELFNIAVGRDAAVIVVLFNTSPGECLKRNVQRLHPVPDDVMRRMIVQYQEIDRRTLKDEIPEGCQIYNQDTFMGYQWDFFA